MLYYLSSKADLEIVFLYLLIFHTEFNVIFIWLSLVYILKYVYNIFL